MKYFFILAVVLQHVAYAFPSAVAEQNLSTAYTLSKTNPKEAANLCTSWINDQSTSLVDLVHYLVARSNYVLASGNKEGYYEDFNRLEKLCGTNPRCAQELFTYYEISFLTR